MCHRITLFLLFISFNYAMNLQAADYSVRSLTTNTAEISFVLDAAEMKGKTSDKTFVFAVTSQPSVTVTARITELNGISCNGTCVTPLSCGWAGSTFLQWFSGTVQVTGKNRAPDVLPGGTLMLSFNKPIIKTSTRYKTTATKNCILTLPVKSTGIKRTSPEKPVLPYTQGIRMSVSLEGIYKITGSELKKLGVPIQKTLSKSYRLFCKNKEIPIFISNIFHTYLKENDHILFFGQALRGEKSHFTQYSYTNVYWLTWGGPISCTRVADASGELKVDPYNFNPDIYLKAREFIDTTHLEVDHEILWQGDIAIVEETENGPLTEIEMDNWFWGVIGSKKLTQFTFLLPSPVTSSTFSMKIALSGLSGINSIPDDHQYTFSINNKGIPAKAVWDGQNNYELVINSIPSEVLSHGENVLTAIRSQADTIPDRAALNWFDIGYTKGFRALNDRITFHNNPKDILKWIHFELTDFTSSDLELWDITKFRKFKDFTTDRVTGTYTLSFQDSITGPSKYYAQTVNLRLSPQDMVLDTIHDSWDFPGGIDYIIVTPQYFIPTFEPLIEVHTQAGLQVEAIALQDIYNRFSYGIRNPESIRSMLSYVYDKHRTNPPRYLLLGGDASHDMDKAGGIKTRNVVPTHLTQVPNWGPGANDDYFVTMHGDDNFPDMYVGRFPAGNTLEMETIVRKTVNYLRFPEHGYWRDNIILVGGEEQDFTAFNNTTVTNNIGPRMNVFRMDADPQSPFYTSTTGASDKLAGYINAGAYFLHFTGHGGGNTWSDSKFFSFTDLSKLHNSQWSTSGRLPIVFSFTCLTGFFESNFYPSLGEEFLRQSANGCISFYGASAYTRSNIDIRMAGTMLYNAVHNTFSNLGELINTTEMIMLAVNASEAIPLTRQYNLLGDPALPLKLTPNNLAVTLADSNLKGSDTLKTSGSTVPVTTGNVKLSVTAENNIPWAEIIKNVSGGTFNHTFPLKQASQTARGLVRAYAWNDSSEVMGWAEFSKDTFTLHDVTISPAFPAIGDSVSISCRIESYDSAFIPTAVQCRYTVENPQEQTINFDGSVFMAFDTLSGLWKSQKRIVVGSPDKPFDFMKQLILKFFATGKLGASDFFFFRLRGRPDLIFTSDSIGCIWQNDSLYVTCEILNKGNSAAPPFSIIFYNSTKRDTVFSSYSADSLLPGKTTAFNFAIADTQGTISYTGVVNANQAFEEVLHSNNSALLKCRVAYANLFTPADTLFSLQKGCFLVPNDTLSSIHRVFLFSDTLPGDQPLLSASTWEPLSGDGLSDFYIHARPALAAADSLQWIFIPAQPGIINTTLTDSGSHAGVFFYDTLSEHWLNRGGIPNTVTNTTTLLTNEPGPHAFGTFGDNIPPEIRVYVAGKEILFLDYAAKNKPFNIFITDSSGIAKPSIQLLLNGTPLSSDYKSSSVTGEHPSTVVLTAYPQKINSVDSLTIKADDNAGNHAEKVFSYRPGEKLKIKFFSCHPNPFSAKQGKLIRFPFLLTDVATRVTLTIYTISGRKLWTWKSSTELIGYNEIAWDGTTRNMRNMNKGYRIANGTYYAKLVARNASRKVQKIIRIAKLEGFEDY